MTKKIEAPDPNHHVGKHTGYTLKDGKYFLAPLYTEQQDRLRDERDGLEALMAAVLRFQAQALQVVVHKERAWWKHVLDDLEIERDPSEPWRYNYHGGFVYKEEKPKDA